ncbi:MAG: DUF393 domain-containing protein [Roseovarius sp.]|nr:DUF393 domain-containing protein [Roseovarius sp.]
MTGQADDAAPLTVYYDGGCPLCRAEIGHYAAQDGAEAIHFVDLAAPGGDPGPELTREAALARFHVRLPDGTLRSGAAGFAAIWRRLPRWRWAARLAALPGALKVLEVLYRGFLPLRPWLARAFARVTGRACHTDGQGG